MKYEVSFVTHETESILTAVVQAPSYNDAVKLALQLEFETGLQSFDLQPIDQN